MDIKPKKYKRSGSNIDYKKKKSLNKARNKTFTCNNNQGYNMKFSGSSSKSKKNLEEMMKDYKKFVKKYFGNANPRDYLSEERINEIIEGKDKKNINQNVILQNEKNYLIYEKLVKNNIDSDFVDEDIEIQIPSSNEIYYNEENRLGKHKNNINDYNKRKKKYDRNENKDNEICDEKYINTKPEDKEEEEEEEKDKEDIEDKGDKPEEEEKELEKEDKVHENIRPDSKSSICEDYDTRQDKEIKVKKIQKIFREKRSKDKLYIGLDKSKCNFIRIYADEYDQNNKIKSLEVFIYLLIDKESLVIKKSIKELLKRDSISKNSLKKCMDEVIEKILAIKEDTINLDLISETSKIKGIINSSKKEEDIFIVKKKNVNKNEEDKKKDDNENEEDKKKNESANGDSLIGDADYNF